MARRVECILDIDDKGRIDHLDSLYTPSRLYTPAMSFKKDEESGGMCMYLKPKGSDIANNTAFYNDKTTVIQEARVFNESPISPRKCRALLTRIIYLLYAGETFSTQEATTLFFGVTKLFQHKDVSSNAHSTMNNH